MIPQRITHTVKFFDTLSGSWVTKTVEGKPIIRPALRLGLTIAANGRMAFSPPTMDQAKANAQRAFKKTDITRDPQALQKRWAAHPNHHFTEWTGIYVKPNFRLAQD